MKEEFGEIYFTEYDEKITGTSKRDPLGLQPIWSYYGRRVIKHLTTISDDIRGFREVLLCLSVCSSVKDNHSNMSYKDLILLFEQLFVYSAIINDKKDGILGADNGAVRYSNTKMNTKVSIDNTVLVREISLGYYGRYKTPLTTMGVIDKYSYVCVNVDLKEMYGESTYSKILKEFDKFVSLKLEDRTLRNFSAFDQIFEAVDGTFRPNEVQFWLEKFQVTGKQTIELMTECYNIVDTKQYFREVFDDLLADAEVYDIENLEPFLRCMEYIFYRALRSKNMKDIVIEQDVLDVHISRYRNFLTISDTEDGNSQMLNERMKFIREKCNPEEHDYVQNILGYHKMVCGQKRSAVWMESDISTGNIQVFIQPDVSDINIYEWGRDYYLSSLDSIKQGIKERVG